jgi:WD40 repeat protein
LARAERDDSQPVSFVRDIAPILVTRCQACHGAKTAESNYRLDTFESLMRAGDFELPPVTAGDLENSEIYRLITSEDAVERMPNNGERLADAEIESITSWILQGARFDGQDAAAPLQNQIPRDIPHPAAPEKYARAIPVSALVFTADGNRLVAGGYHELLVWDVSTGALLERVGNIPQRTFNIAISADGSWLAVAGGSPGVSGEVRLIPWADGRQAEMQPKVLATHGDVFFDVAFHPDGNSLAVGAADGSVRVFEVESGMERLRISNHASWVSDVCFNSDGTRIATASRDKTAKVFDAESGALLATYSDHNAPVRAVAFAPDGKSVISAAENRTHVWNVEDSKRIGELAGFGEDIYSLAATGDTVIAASADRSARLFTISDRKELRAFADHPTWILSLARHEPSHVVATGCFDGTVTIWNTDNGNMVQRFVAVPRSASTPAD